MGNILVIEDEKDVLLMISKALRIYGFDVETAMDGLEGIKKFDKGDFDLVVTDIRMPGLDGNGVLRHIRNSEKYSTPVIGISGTHWLLDNDFDTYLLKPFSIKTLVDTVKNLTEPSLSTKRLHSLIA